MTQAEVVHDRPALGDRRARRVETAGKALEAADADEAVRLDPPVRRLVQDRPAAGERRLDVLRPPKGIGDDVSDRGSFASLVTGGWRGAGSALVKSGGASGV